MVNYSQLNNAPITEALIDIRTKIPKSFNPKSFLELKDTLAKRYPNSEERRFFTQKFGIKDGRPQDPLTEDHGIHGYFFRPENGKNVAQFRVDGFTFSRLKPYTKWEDLFKEAKKLWKMYSEISQPEAITRLAVRYINQINIPSPVNDLSRYLKRCPEIPNGTEGVISSFLSKIVVYNQNMDILTNIIQALEKSPKPDKNITVILDIDTFKAGEFEADDETVWDMLLDLRDIKNQIFYASITDECKRLFE